MTARFLQRISAALFPAFLVLVIGLALALRFHTIFAYNTYWADDGGFHLDYVDTLRRQGRLPDPEHNLLAWHEPLFYILAALWAGAGSALAVSSPIDWLEGFQALISIGTLAVIGHLAWRVSGGQRFVTAAVTALLAFLFASVKLSAYVTNELLAQTSILLAISFFYTRRMGERVSAGTAIAWAALVGISMLVKITAVIILLAAILTWGWQYARTRKLFFLKAILVSCLIAGVLHIPWAVYKYRQFGAVFSVNLAETLPKQSLLRSSGWQTVRSLNLRVVTDYPYWFAGPHSFLSIVLSDTFSDYYNLFNPVDAIHALPQEEKILVQNGRYTTPALWQTMLRANRMGLVIALVWTAGMAVWLLERRKARAVNAQELFLLTAVLGGVSALLYNFLRLPYPERGTLKIHFIYFVLPIIATLSYSALMKRWQRKLLPAALIGLPILLYSIVVWPLLWV